MNMDTEAQLLSSSIDTSSFQNNAQISVTVNYVLPELSPSGTVEV